MPEPLTIGLLVYLTGEKLIEATVEDLAKRFTTEVIPKIPEFWNKIKTRLTGRSPKVDEALVKVEEGDSKAIETITKHLDVVLDEDHDFAEELKILAETIQAGEIKVKDGNYKSIMQFIDKVAGSAIVVDKIENDGSMYFGPTTNIHPPEQPVKKNSQ